MKKDTLVLCLALNGYFWRYRSNIQTHKAYSEKHGYNYILINQPQICLLGIESVWLKITILREAFKTEYKYILFLDSDTKIQIGAPDITQLIEKNFFLYVAKGYSDRINSGVMLYKNCMAARKFVNTLIENIHTPIPEQDAVGWGENGHIIHFAKNNSGVRVISQKWNNNEKKDLKDYVRHYSAGPLRQEYSSTKVEYLMFMLYQAFLSLCKYALHIENFLFAKRLSFIEKLEAFTQKIVANHPELNRHI